jgi:hypothetical protein
MSARADLDRAAAEARAQVDHARAALAASRDASGGGPAKNARQAEEQLHRLRGAVADDVRALRDRLTGLDDGARRGATTAAALGAGALVTLVGSGLAVRRSVRRGLKQREVRQQATAIAKAMAGSVLAPTSSAAVASRSPRGRVGRGALLATLALGAVAGGAALVQQRRSAPVDDADLWLPERDLGPA